MRIVSALLACLVFFLAQPATAGDKVLYGTSPAWVKAVAIPESKATSEGALELLLLSQQEHLGRQSHERYMETAIKVRSPQGLSEAGMLAGAWDPATSDLTVIKAEIIRDGQVIDLLASGDRFSVLRRERNLSAAIIDGTLTAILEAKGLRVGDVVHLATLTETRDPVLGPHRETMAALPAGGKGVGRMHLRQVWPKDVAVRWKASDPYAAHMKRSETSLGTELEVDLANPEFPAAPAGAPARYLFASRVELTAFEDWSDLSRMLAASYAKAAVLAPDSPLRAEVEKIRAQHATPEARALAALQLVEHDVRYLALVLNAGGLVPATADETWSRRFGDCKAKTVLLIALLGELGIKAEPALVSSDGGFGMDQDMPRVGAFDHVIVRAEIGGKTYWLDGTRPTDRSLVSLSGLPFAFALPMRPEGAGLMKIDWAPPAKPLREDVQETDISSGVEGKVPSKLSVLLRGDEGMVLDLLLKQVPRSEIDEGLKAQFADSLAWLDVEKVDYRWDEAEEGLRIEFTGKGRYQWRSAGASWIVGLTDTVREKYPERKEGSDKDAPYVLSFPYYYSETIRVVLPKGQVRRDLAAGDGELIAGGVRYLRKSAVKDGMVEVTQSQQVLVNEFPAAEAMAHNRSLDTSPFARMATLTYGSGGVSDAVQAQVADLVRLAQANIESGNRTEAKSYLTRALRLDPKNANLLSQRMSLALRDQDYALAVDDAIALRKMNPNLGAYLNEASVLLMAKRYREAMSATQEAQRLNAPADMVAMNMALSQAGLDRPSEMLKLMDSVVNRGSETVDDLDLPDLTRIIQAKPPAQKERFIRALEAEPQSPSSRMVQGALLMQAEPGKAAAQFGQALLIRPNFTLARRMRIAAHVGAKDYAEALKDAEFLLANDPNNPTFLGMKAQVLFEQRDTAKAVDAYGALIKQQPGNSSLYNERCWTRAIAAVDLPLALADCDKAIELRPNNAAALDSRGLVNLRMNRLKEAIADFDGSLANRELAGSYFGRALAKRLSGDAAGADADLAKAKALDPKVVEEYAGYGLTP